MEKINACKLITCILPKGKALPLMEALAGRNIRTANFANARGSDLAETSKSSKLLLEEEEKEIVTVVAASEQQAEELFDFIYQQAEIHRRGGGIIYMSSLGFSTPYQVEFT